MGFALATVRLALSEETVQLPQMPAPILIFYQFFSNSQEKRWPTNAGQPIMEQRYSTSLYDLITLLLLKYSIS